MNNRLKYVKQYFNEVLKNKNQIFWSYTRKLKNIFQADQINCYIINVTQDILKKIEEIKKKLTQLALEILQIFLVDDGKVEFKIKINK